MTQQSQMRHRGEFGRGYTHDEWRALEVDWSKVPEPTEEDLAAFEQGTTEAKALLLATGGDACLMQKFLTHRREEKQVALERKALGFGGVVAASGHPYALVRQGARGPFVDRGDASSAHQSRFQSKGRGSGDFYYHLARLRGERE